MTPSCDYCGLPVPGRVPAAAQAAVQGLTDLERPDQMHADVRPL